MSTEREIPQGPDLPDERVIIRTERAPRAQAQPETGETTRTVTTPTPGVSRSVRPAPPATTRRPRYGQPFWPVTIYGSAMYILATAVALIVLSSIHPADLQNPADPLNHEKVNPRPEWYFLFLFQILKYFGGPLEIIGTAVIPGILTVILIGLPFYDRNWSRRAVKRPIAIGAGGLAVAAIALLTYIPIAQTQSSQGGGAYLAAVVAHPKYVNIQAIFSKNCQPCHYAPSYTNGLHLDTYQGALAGGIGGAGLPKKVIIPGNAAQSYLWRVVAWKIKSPQEGLTMPLGRPQIASQDITNIANWIKDGAKNT